MRFALSGEQRDFAASIGDLLTSADTPKVVRSWSDGVHEPGLALWRRLAELGVHGLLVPEEHGGIGADAVDLAVAFEALGYHAVPGPLVESVAVLPGLLARTTLAERWLPALTSGDALGTVAHPTLAPYALDADVADLRVLLGSDGVRSFTPGKTLASVDAARRLFEVEPGEVLAVPETDVERALDHGVLAVAAQLLGAGARLLADTVDYAKQRVQYGKPIGQYQAVKHLLADVVTRLELARPLVHGAAVALAQSSDTTSRDTSAARVACADAAYLAARTALQVHGAIGYTAEHDLGLWLTKVRALVGAWGTQSYHRDRVLQALRQEAARC